MPGAEKIPQPPARIFPFGNGVGDIGPIETVDKQPGLFQSQLADNFLAGPLIGGGGERDTGNVGIAIVKGFELLVFDTKVMTLLRDTVGLVNGEQGELATIQQGEGVLAQQPLRRQIDNIQRIIE